MSTVEILHHVVDQLPEEAQKQLLLYAQQLLETNDVSADEPTRGREQKLEQLLLERYASYNEGGQKGRPLDEVIQEIKATHGLRQYVPDPNFRRCRDRRKFNHR